MPYTPQTWNDNDAGTPLSAARLTHMETGISDAFNSAPVTSVATKTGAVTLVEGDIANLTSDLALKSPLASPTFTGTPTAPTVAGSTDSTTKIATTAFVQAVKASLTEADIASLTSDLALKAPLASPTFTGVPAAPTASGGTNTTQIATTAFVAAMKAALTESDIANLTSDLALKAPLASPTFTGTPAAPTAAASTNTTQIATTAYVVSRTPQGPHVYGANADFVPLAATTGGVLAATLTPYFYPIVLPGVSSLTIDSLAYRITAQEAASTVGQAIYSLSYSSANTFTATLECQLNAAGLGSGGAGIVANQVTTGAAGSGVTPFTFDFVGKYYALGSMVSSITTLALSTVSFGNTYTGVGIHKWSAAARSSTTDWPSSFTDSSVATTGTARMPWTALKTATGALFK